MIAASKAGSQVRFASFEELMAYGRSDGRLLQPAAGLLRRIRRIFKKKSEAPKMQICRVGEIEPDPAFAFMLCGLLLSCGKKQKMIEYTQSFAKKAQEGNGLDSH